MKRQIEGQLSIFDLLREDIENPEEEVQVEGVVNLKTSPISHYKVSLCYGELTLIIAILRDYVKGLDKMLEDGDLPINEIEYEAYYRNKFLGISDKISEQIEYNYEEKLKKCLKKLQKEDNSDIGEEALSLTMKRAAKAYEQKQREEEEKKNETDTV